MRRHPGRFCASLAEPAPDLFGRAGESLRAELLPQHGSILATFGQARMEIREMRINDAVARAVRSTLRKRLGLGVFTHRSTGQLHRAGDGQQRLASAMAAADLLIKCQTPGATAQTNLDLRDAAWKGPGTLGRPDAGAVLSARQPPQTGMYASDPALDRLAHVGQQMPSVRNLNRTGRP